jgi:transcriptional regulator with XRE-family HTH domain
MGQPRSTYRLRSRILFNELIDGEWSLRALADRAGCGKTMIWNLKTGEDTTCSQALAERLSEALGIKMSALFAPVSSTPVDESSKQAA